MLSDELEEDPAAASGSAALPAAGAARRRGTASAIYEATKELIGLLSLVVLLDVGRGGLTRPAHDASIVIIGQDSWRSATGQRDRSDIGSYAEVRGFVCVINH